MAATDTQQQVVQFGVETTYKGQTHVDTQYNGGFKTADQAEYAAKNGYIAEVAAVAVERTVTYGPWTPIKKVAK